METQEADVLKLYINLERSYIVPIFIFFIFHPGL